MAVTFSVSGYLDPEATTLTEFLKETRIGSVAADKILFLTENKGCIKPPVVNGLKIFGQR